jgi:transcription elongation GreA/GreB family factor
VNKPDLIKKIIAQLAAELELYFRAARAAHAEATHEQSKAENKYDTRGLEASYLARGQSRQAAEIAQAIKQFEALPARDFGAKDPIDIGALVELEMKGERLFYFVGPCAGGTEIAHGKKEVLVITPPSPLGQQLIGKTQGDRLNFEIGGARNNYRIIAVS